MGTAILACNLVEEHTQVVGPDHEGEETLPEGEMEETDRVEPADEPERADGGSGSDRLARDLDLFRHGVLAFRDHCFFCSNREGQDSMPAPRICCASAVLLVSRQR